jgi:hypothetical protein
MKDEEEEFEAISVPLPKGKKKGKTVSRTRK